MKWLSLIWDCFFAFVLFFFLVLMGEILLADVFPLKLRLFLLSFMGSFITLYWFVVVRGFEGEGSGSGGDA